jgi:molybdenum cofactor biosynthesis enzyme MoaA
MPADEDPALRLAELSLRIERLRAALTGKLANALAAEERAALQDALSAAEAEQRRLERDPRSPPPEGSAD